MKVLRNLVVVICCAVLLFTGSIAAAAESSIFKNEVALQDQLYDICYSKLNRLCDIYFSSPAVFDPDYIDYAYNYFKLYLSVVGVSDSLGRMTEKEKSDSIIFSFDPDQNDVSDIQATCIINSVVDSKWAEYAAGSLSSEEFAKTLMTIIKMELTPGIETIINNNNDPAVYSSECVS